MLETAPLGYQWPTVDPFLFCVHHVDDYPRGNEYFGPAASLAGREIGADFELRDGWRMYHGDVVPGFPAHPHRGFETVTFARRGYIDHSDSLGAAARFGRGDVQWVTAGRGIMHSEMFPLLSRTDRNPVELFQIWLNLPASRKMAAPHFTMLWSEDLGHHRVGDDGAVEVTTIAGAFDGRAPSSPPPDSWAAQADADVAIWHLAFEPGARWILPAAASGTAPRCLYLFAGDALAIGEREIGSGTVAALADGPVALRAGDSACECLLLQGRPIGEPGAQHGPFVMNDRAGIEQAFADFRATEFGGWPWDRPDPVHGDAGQGRFARLADGSLVTPPS